MALTSCGVPGSDAVFEAPKAKTPAADSSAANAAVSSPASSLVTRQYSGYFRRMNDTAQFQPCGSKTVLEVFATPTGRAALRERYRFAAPWAGAKMFSVFRGAIVTDTAVGVGEDSARATPRTRFLVAAVDSMRARRDSDCGGMSPS